LERPLREPAGVNCDHDPEHKTRECEDEHDRIENHSLSRHGFSLAPLGAGCMHGH
jgi:hypothetical protein